MNIKNEVSIFFKKPYLNRYDELEILIVSENNSLARFANNDIVQSVSQERTSIRFRVLKDKKSGVASTNDLTELGLIDCFNKSLEILSFMPSNEEQISLYDDKKNVKSNEFVKTITHKERAQGIKNALDYVKELGMLSAGIDTQITQKIILLNSNGLEKESISSGANFSISITKPNKGWAQEIKDTSLDIDHLEIAKKAVDIAIKNKDAISIEAKEYDVVLSPEAVGDLVSFLNWYAFNGKSFYEKSAPFTELNKKVLGENITITDNPFNSIRKGHSFDYEGVEKVKFKLIENGKLVGIPLDRLYAQKLNLETTGHSLPQPNSWGAFPLSVILKGGDSSIDEMIKSTKYGLYVNRFHYTNIINPKEMSVTGMTRDGLFLIEDGKITRAVKNLRFTESIIKVFNNVESLSKKLTIADFDTDTSLIVPAIKVKDFRFTSTTEF